MKQNITVQRSPKREAASPRGPITIGMDLGDRSSRYCLLDGQGEVVKEASAATTKKGLQLAFGARPHCRIAIEVGTHSPWVSRLLSRLGHEVIVANARPVKLISQSSRKDDRLEAEMLARLARADPRLLRPVRHRSEKAQQDLMVIRVRASLLEARTSLVNSARGLAKAMGERLPMCDADNLGPAKMVDLPASLQQTVKP